MSNVECRILKECILSFSKKIEKSETILRNSAVRYSIFSGSLFPGFCGLLFNSAARHLKPMNLNGANTHLSKRFPGSH